MEGVEGVEEDGVLLDEDELSDDGSVDIEGESEDELLEEDQMMEGEGDEMEVDKPDGGAAAGVGGNGLHSQQQPQQGEAMVH